MSGGQDWAAELISTTGDDMSDKKTCHSQVSDNDLITVHWKDEHDNGWRVGVVMCVLSATWHETEIKYMRCSLDGDSLGKCGEAVIYDRHRHERAIVPLAKVQIVEPRCEACGGTGVDCEACHGSGKRA